MKNSRSNCNHCASKTCKAKVYSAQRPDQDCPIWVDPSGTFSLAELALEHLQGLYNALNALPFKPNLEFYLK